jgi:hypothetical protein
VLELTTAEQQQHVSIAHAQRFAAQLEVPALAVRTKDLAAAIACQKTRVDALEFPKSLLLQAYSQNLRRGMMR